MSIVIAHHDRLLAHTVAHDLQAHFIRVAVVTEATELSHALLHHRARVAVLDLELVGVDEVQELCRSFADLIVICTHRTPDLRMWTAALDAGAVELCHPSDTGLIVGASRRLAKHHKAIGA